MAVDAAPERRRVLGVVRRQAAGEDECLEAGRRADLADCDTQQVRVSSVAVEECESLAASPDDGRGHVAENGEDPWGNERIGLELTTTIDRREFDLKWNQTLPNGNLLVANEVKLLVSVSAVKSA